MARVSEEGGDEEPEEEENLEVSERIKSYQQLADMAYELLDGKYKMHEIKEMPYRELIDIIEREQKFQEELAIRRESRQNNNQ